MDWQGGDQAGRLVRAFLVSPMSPLVPDRTRAVSAPRLPVIRQDAPRPPPGPLGYPEADPRLPLGTPYPVSE
jgi:hypothetical protein